MIIMNAGSSYFEHVENYYGSNACEQNSCRNAEMPAELKTEKAQRIKNNLIEIGMVTENFMPAGLSSSEAAILANPKCNFFPVHRSVSADNAFLDEKDILFYLAAFQHAESFWV